MTSKSNSAKAAINCLARGFSSTSSSSSAAEGGAAAAAGAQSAMPDMKYILVTGGVISGVGKGVIASSFGTLLNCCGIDVTSIKIDPYINIDAGTFSPLEHGKCRRNSPHNQAAMTTT